MILRTLLLEDPEQYMILRSLLEGPDTMEAPGHMSPGHMSTRTSVSPGHMSTRTHVYPDKNARTPVARTHIPRTTGAASLGTTQLKLVFDILQITVQILNCRICILILTSMIY